jgi:AbrB family looped-hinge helix DNA binding protein
MAESAHVDQNAEPAMSESFRVKVQEAGRIVIPAALRRELGIEEDGELLLSRDGPGIRLIPLQQAIRQAQDLFAGMAPPEVVLSEELIRDRREEAADE